MLHKPDIIVSDVQMPRSDVRHQILVKAPCRPLDI
jgi:CheY-like chemotaxis protein